MSTMIRKSDGHLAIMDGGMVEIVSEPTVSLFEMSRSAENKAQIKAIKEEIFDDVTIDPSVGALDIS